MQEHKTPKTFAIAAIAAMCVLMANFGLAQATLTGTFDLNLEHIERIVNGGLTITGNLFAGIAGVSSGIGSILGIVALLGVVVALAVMVNPFDWLNRTGVGRWISMRK